MTYAKSDYKRVPLYANVPESDWNDWRWQMRNDIKDVETLSRVVPLSDQEKKDIGEVLKKFRMAITPYYASLIDPPTSSARVSAAGQTRLPETFEDPADEADPLHEDVDSPVLGLTHRIRTACSYW
jgi:lysine 2,3-aminomutase